MNKLFNKLLNWSRGTYMHSDYRGRNYFKRNKLQGIVYRICLRYNAYKFRTLYTKSVTKKF